jgi:hypothetical protein
VGAPHTNKEIQMASLMILVMKFVVLPFIFIVIPIIVISVWVSTWSDDPVLPSDKDGEKEG